MANTDMYKFQVIEGIIKAIDFKSKEEVVDLAKRMKDPVILKIRNFSIIRGISIPPS